MFSSALVAKCVTFAASATDGCCSGVLRRHWFNALTPYFVCALFHHFRLFVIMGWMVQREAP